MNQRFAQACLLASALCAPVDSSFAVEGSMGTYLVGTRDLVMGVVPPPGIYVSHDVVYYTGNLHAGTLVGATVSNADLDLLLNKTVLTAVALASCSVAASASVFRCPSSMRTSTPPAH